MIPPGNVVPQAVEHPVPRAASLGRTIAIGVVALIVIGGLLAIGVVPRWQRKQRVDAAAADATGPRRVVVGTAHFNAGPTTMTLPASANAYRTGSVYAKASGFVRKVHVDLGDEVKAGQVLVELEIPESDQDVHRAHAQMEEAEANVGLFEANAKRNNALAAQGVVSSAQAETVTEQANSARAAAKTSRAELERLTALQRYQRIVAPFAGVISRRLVEPGQLVSVGSGTGTGALLVEVSDTSRLRVFFDVPQSLAIDLHVGQDAAIFYPNDPKREVAGKILRTSGALDPTLRTLKAEIDLDGKSGIIAGAFVSVRVSVPRAAPVILIAGSALAVRKDGPQVAIVKDGKVRWQAIALGRDLGKELEVVRGVSEGDKLVLNPEDDLIEGQEVRATDRGQ